MPRERLRVYRVLLNPLVVSVAVAVMLTAGWLLYIDRATSTAQARPGENLFPPLVSTAPKSSERSSSSAPSATAGWEANHSGDANISLDLVAGQMRKNALELDVDRHASGDVTLTSPRVTVDPGETYLFKAFTTYDVDFTLLIRRHHADGSTTLRQLPTGLQRPNNAPFTVSHAFESEESTTAVEYVFRLGSKGTVRIEDVYLEAAQDVVLPPAAVSGPNLVPDSQLAGSPQSISEQWWPYSSGTSTVESGLDEDEDGSFLWTRIANYQSGEAKWEYQPAPVTPDQSFRFDATYRADREVDVVAEFELSDGGRTLQNLVTVPPAGEWTELSELFEIPAKAKTAMVTLVSHGDGTTGIRDYSLTDATLPGPLRWEEPQISITFDDGWHSVYERALPLLDQYDFRSTQYVNPSTIETPNFMTAAEIQQMQEAGHEIASHSYEHIDLTSVDADRIDEELSRSKEELAAAGLDSENLAPPYGRSDPQVDWYADEYFETIRGTEQGLNTRQNLDPRDLKVFYVTEDTTSKDLEKALAEVTRRNGWLILVYHQIVSPDVATAEQESVPADGSTITSDVFDAHMQLVERSNVEVQTVAEAYEQVRPR